MTATVRSVFASFICLFFSGMSHAGFAAEDAPVTAPLEAKQHVPEMIRSDSTLRLSFGQERVILPRGLQPSLLSRSGTLIVQAQVPDKPFAAKRISYFSAMRTEVSRDGGLSWTTIPLKPGENGLDMENIEHITFRDAEGWRVQHAPTDKSVARNTYSVSSLSLAGQVDEVDCAAGAMKTGRAPSPSPSRIVMKKLEVGPVFAGAGLAARGGTGLKRRRATLFAQKRRSFWRFLRFATGC